MSRRRTALVTAGIAAGAVASGLVARRTFRARRSDPAVLEDLELLPPEDLGPVRSFDGTPLAVRAAGDPSAPCLVFVHGFGLDMTTWRHQWPELADRFRCVLLDLRSHGRSGAAASGDLSPGAFGRDVLAVLATVDRNRGTVVVGHSMGGIAMLAAAEVDPHAVGADVRGAVFVGAASGDLLRGALGSLTGAIRPTLGSVRSAFRGLDAVRRSVLSGPSDVGHLVTRLTQFGPDAPHEAVDHVAMLAARARPELWRDGLPELVDVDLGHVVQHLRAPTLVLVGEHDRVTPVRAARALAEALPDGRLEIVRGAGHIPMLERPEEVTAAIRAFAEERLA